MNVNTYFGNGLEYRPGVMDQVELFLDEKVLEQPLHWRKPTMVFPCSMTDLFGRWVKDEWLDRIFAVMAHGQHGFQVLTKRPQRMCDYMLTANRIERV
jgi:protein gp37